jgi:hypothetical protein
MDIRSRQRCREARVPESDVHNFKRGWRLSPMHRLAAAVSNSGDSKCIAGDLDRPAWIDRSNSCLSGTEPFALVRRFFFAFKGRHGNYGSSLSIIRGNGIVSRM